MMTKDEFSIGLEFYVGGGKWRCTDIGTRVIVAIKIDPVVTNQATLTQDEANKEGWFSGPPYALAEIVFDEDDLEICSLQADEPHEEDEMKKAAT